MIAKRSYTHLFTSPKITLSKKFKANILDNSTFAQQISLLAIDKIYLIKEWSKNFCLLYAEIEKIRTRILPYIPLLGMSAMLTKTKRLQVLNKTRFRKDYQLM